MVKKSASICDQTTTYKRYFQPGLPYLKGQGYFAAILDKFGVLTKPKGHFLLLQIIRLTFVPLFIVLDE